MNIIKSSLPRRSPETVDRSLCPDSYPAFLPHITLATIPLSDGISDVLFDAVPQNHQPIRANFQSLVVGDHYFRSVFIDIQPTQELLGFQNQILANLRHRGLEPSAPRFPHMSLCYIADQDKSERERTAQALESRGVIKQMSDTQSIWLQCGDTSLTGFDGAEVWVVNCVGPAETWQVNDSKKVRFG